MRAQRILHAVQCLCVALGVLALLVPYPAAALTEGSVASANHKHKAKEGLLAALVDKIDADPLFESGSAAFVEIQASGSSTAFRRNGAANGQQQQANLKSSVRAKGRANEPPGTLDAEASGKLNSALEVGSCRVSESVLTLNVKHSQKEPIFTVYTRGSDGVYGRLGKCERAAAEASKEAGESSECTVQLSTAASQWEKVGPGTPLMVVASVGGEKDISTKSADVTRATCKSGDAESSLAEVADPKTQKDNKKAGMFNGTKTAVMAVLGITVIAAVALTFYKFSHGNLNPNAQDEGKNGELLSDDADLMFAAKAKTTPGQEEEALLSAWRDGKGAKDGETGGSTK